MVGLALGQVQQFEEAITAFQRAADLHRETEDRDGEGKAWNNLGVALMDVGRFGEAIPASQHDIAICEELGDHYEQAHTLGNIGSVYTELDQREQARRAWIKAAELSPRSVPRMTPTRYVDCSHASTGSRSRSPIGLLIQRVITRVHRRPDQEWLRAARSHARMAACRARGGDVGHGPAWPEGRPADLPGVLYPGLPPPLGASRVRRSGGCAGWGCPNC